MLTREENERLTRVGPGTPVGELLRRYWHVVAVATELEADPVRPVRILGEDLVLFRAPTPPNAPRELGSESAERITPPPMPALSGAEGLGEGLGERATYGLVGPRCAHRGISLAYGVPQQNGLRCAYHGWTYSAQGQVVAMPFEPACLSLKITAYPVQELGGLIFAYLGPEPGPLLPRWDLLVREDLDRSIRLAALDCNWLQPMDNAMDPVHFEHLHAAFGNYVMRRRGKPPAMSPARHVKIDFDVFEYGIFKRRLLEGEPEDCDDWTTGHPVLFPNILAQGGDTPSFQIRVPVDDTHTVVYWYTTRSRPTGSPPQDRIPLGPQPHKREDGSLVMDTIPGQDMLAWVGQGPISDRSAEHLATSDKGILLYRKILAEEIAKVERGEDPMGVIRDPAKNYPMIPIPRERRRLQAFHIAPESGERRPVAATS